MRNEVSQKDKVKSDKMVYEKKVKAERYLLKGSSALGNQGKLKSLFPEKT